MQKVLRKRVFRDLRTNLWRYLALGLMIVMAMFLVVSIVGSGENLTQGTEKLAEETNLEDGEFSVFIPLTQKQKDKIRDMGFALEEEFFVDYGLEDQYKSTLRIFSLRKRINRLHLVEGEEPKASGQLVLEKRFAEEHGFSAGDKIQLGKDTYLVSGVGCVADYDAPYKEISDTSCNSKYFGLAFMRDEDYKKFLKSGQAQKAEEYVYAYTMEEAGEHQELKDYLKDIEIESDQVEDEYFQEYWERTGGMVDDLRDAVKDLREATDKISDGMGKLSDHNGDLRKASREIFVSYLDQASQSLKSYGLEEKLTEKNYKSQLDKMIEESDSGLVRMGLRDAKSQLEDLEKYKDGIYDYTKGVKDLSKGSGDMSDALKDMDQAVDDAVDEFDVGLSNLTRFLPREDNIRIFATKEDKSVDISTGLFAGALLLILMAYVISVFVVHSIEKESSIIGTLYSLGVKKRDLIIHYVSLPVIITSLSGLVGSGVAATGIMVPTIAQSSYEYFSIPYFDFKVAPYLWVYSLLVPPVLSVIVNVFVINKKLSQTALSLIRNEKKAKKVRKINLSGLDFVAAFRIRQFLREFRSSLAVVFGMFFSLLIFMLAVDCYTMCNNLALDYKRDTKYEYMYVLKYPEKEAPEGGEIAYSYGFKKENMGHNFDINMLGLSEESKYFDLEPTKSRSQVVISSAMAEKFSLSPGDEFTVDDEEQELKYAFTVKEIARQSTGFFIFMDIDTMRDMMGQSSDYYNVIFSDKALQIESERLYSTTGKEDVVKGAGIFKQLMIPMVLVLTFASVIIFCMVMYLMMKVMVDRSAVNISLVKIFGYRRKEIKKLYLDGNFYVVVLSGALGLPLSKLLVNNLFPYMISNVNCGLNLKVPFYFYLIAFVAILLLYFVINTLLVRKLESYTPADILKNRE
ncbi:MAG: ABC transporter permease [Eubacterium sp.]|nr:ABC transporter permease [Eubacterium sp.]